MSACKFQANLKSDPLHTCLESVRWPPISPSRQPLAVREGCRGIFLVFSFFAIPWQGQFSSRRESVDRKANDAQQRAWGGWSPDHFSNRSRLSHTRVKIRGQRLCVWKKTVAWWLLWICLCIWRLIEFSFTTKWSSRGDRIRSQRVMVGGNLSLKKPRSNSDWVQSLSGRWLNL